MSKEITPVIEDRSFMDMLSNNEIFSPEECAHIIETCAPEKWDEATIDGNDGGAVITDHRHGSSHILVPTDENKLIFRKIMTLVIAANNHSFKFDIDHIASIQIAKYEEGDYYKKHYDVGVGYSGNRKLSITVQLSDPDTYERGDLVLSLGDFTAPREIGSVSIFPSFILHEVTPITRGTRYSLVSWIAGTNRFK